MDKQHEMGKIAEILFLPVTDLIFDEIKQTVEVFYQTESLGHLRYIPVPTTSNVPAIKYQVGEYELRTLNWMIVFSIHRVELTRLTREHLKDDTITIKARVNTIRGFDAIVKSAEKFPLMLQFSYSNGAFRVHPAMY